jgi:hypothetical protein
MYFNPNLTAFSWKAMQPTGGPRTASLSIIKTRSFQITPGFAAGG